VYARFWWENLWEGVNLKDLGVDGSGWGSTRNIYIDLVTIFTACFNIQNLCVFRRINVYAFA
jgi:hypothetical protein